MDLIISIDLAKSASINISPLDDINNGNLRRRWLQNDLGMHSVYKGFMLPDFASHLLCDRKITEFEMNILSNDIYFAINEKFNKISHNNLDYDDYDNAENKTKHGERGDIARSHAISRYLLHNWNTSQRSLSFFASSMSEFIALENAIVRYVDSMKANNSSFTSLELESQFGSPSELSPILYIYVPIKFREQLTELRTLELSIDYRNNISPDKPKDVESVEASLASIDNLMGRDMLQISILSVFVTNDIDDAWLAALHGAHCIILNYIHRDQWADLSRLCDAIANYPEMTTRVYVAIKSSDSRSMMECGRIGVDGCILI